MKTILTTVILYLFFQFSVLAQSNYKKIIVSDDIELIQLSEKAYVHVSTFTFPSFGKVSSNGLILIDSGEGFLFDTPVTNEQTETLVNWITDSLQTKVVGFVPNHWHEDCMGGLEYLHSIGVKSYANQMTIDIAKEKGLPQPQQGFTNELTLQLNNTSIFCYYSGAGHALDNIAVWIPSEKILFCGCMAKDIHSTGLGNVADGDANAWPETIEKVIHMFPNAEEVIPGHGEFGGVELLTHTKNLLNNQK